MSSQELATLISEARTWLESDPERALVAASKAEAESKDAASASATDALVLVVLAMVQKGDAEGALKLAEERLASGLASADLRKEVSAMLALSEAQLATGDPETALKEAKRAKRNAVQLGDLPTEARVAVCEARALVNMGSVLEGEKAASEALSLGQKSGDKQPEAAAWLAVGDAREMRKAQLEDIVGPFNKALGIYRQLGERSEEASVLAKLGQVQLEKKPQEALLCGKESMALYRELGLTTGESRALCTVVKAHCAKGEPQDALRVVKDRLASAEQKEQVLFAPANVAAQLGADDHEAALQAAKTGLEIAEELGDRRAEGWMHYSITEVQLAREDIATAIKEAHEAVDAFLEVGDKMGESCAQAALTAAYTMNNQAHRAPHRTLGLEQLGRLVEAISGRNKALFLDAFEKLNSTLGVDKQDFDAVLKPIFKKDKEAEEFYKENSYEYYGLVYEKDNKEHLRKGKNIDRLEMFLGQRFGSMGYGPSFRSVQATWRKGDPYYIGSGSHALSIIQDETKESWEEVAMFQAHPGMMDAALQVQGIPYARG